MVIFQTLFVYITLTILMIYFCYVAAKQKQDKWLYIVIVIYALVFGFRYGVGYDYPEYKKVYECILAGRPSYYEFEPGFMFFIYLLADLGFSSEIFFMLVALLQILFVFKGVDNKNIYPYLAFTFMMGCVWGTYANGLRQQLVFCVLVYALQFIEKKKWYVYYIIIALSITIHNTAWLLIILYPMLLYKEEWIKSIKLQYILLAISLFIMNMNVVNVIFDKFEWLIGYLGYTHYGDDSIELNSGKMYQNIDWGIGAYIILFIDIFVIYWSKNIKEYYDSKFLKYAYNLSFIGVLWSYVFNNSHLFLRVNYYLIGFQYIVAAYTLMYLLKTKKKQALIILCLLYIFLFVGYMYKMETNTAMFIFSWQEDLFFLKREI